MRIRTIKPEFWLHEGLCQCSEFTRLLAIALLNWADDEGYFLAHPNLIKGSLFPFVDDSKNVPGSLQELSRVGWIELGEDDQKRSVGKILNFSKHQRVDKPQASKIKASSTFQDQSKIAPRIILDDSARERNGKERNKEHGKEGNTPGVCEPAALDLDFTLAGLFDSVVKAYPINGNAVEAKRALASINPTPADLQDILAKVAILAGRIATLPQSERRYCPAKHTFFEGRRWDDDPDGTPWTIKAAAAARPQVPVHNKWEAKS